MGSNHEPSLKARRAKQRGRVAQSSDVPDFPEFVRLDKQCRICTLVDVKPKLVHSVHAMWTTGLGVRAIALQVKPILIADGDTPIDPACFARHFKGHVDLRIERITGDEDEDEDMEAQPETDKDYGEMRDVILRLQRRIQDLDKCAFLDKEGNLDSNGLSTWAKIVHEFVKAVEALNRMRNGDRLLKQIVEYTAKTALQQMSNPMSARLALLVELSENGKLSTEDLRLFAGEAKGIMTLAYKQSVAESVSRMKLN